MSGSENSEQQHVRHFLHKMCNEDVSGISRCSRATKAWFSYVGKIPDDRGFYCFLTVPEFADLWKLEIVDIPDRLGWSPLWVSYRSMTSRFPPFAFVELVSPYNKKNITRWPEDMNFMFSWQEQSHSFASLTREILFLPLEHKIHIFSPPCNILYILLGSSLPVSYICVFSALSNSRQIEYRKNLGQTSGDYPIYEQDLGRSAKSKIPDRLGFSRRMKTRLYGKEMYKKVCCTCKVVFLY